jgi:UbiD family decarboxylase
MTPDSTVRQNVLLAALSGTYLPKFAIAVDEDVDIYDPTDVAWAIIAGGSVRDIIVIPGLRGHPLTNPCPRN